MVDRDALLRLVQALPDGTALPLPRAWLLELLQGTIVTPATAAPIDVDLTPEQAGAALGRSPVTIRAYCAAGLFPGAYRLRGRQYRIPRQSLEAFQQAERKTHAHHTKQRRPAA